MIIVYPVQNLQDSKLVISLTIQNSDQARN